MAVYVSITGLRLNNVFHAPRFWWYAIGSMTQARSAAGNISAETKTVDGVHHTLSVWTDRSAMQAYLTSGRHIKAMKAFRSMATGRVHGFETDVPPGWDDALRLWHSQGRTV